MAFLLQSKFGTEKSEQESNPIPYPASEYLLGSAFLAILTFPNKPSFRVNLAFKYCDYLSNSCTINKFTTLFGVKDSLSRFKQLPVNLNLILELFIHISFGERLLFAV